MNNTNTCKCSLVYSHLRKSKYRILDVIVGTWSEKWIIQTFWDKNWNIERYQRIDTYMSKFGYKVIHRHSQNRFVEIWLALSNSGAGDDTEFIQASPMKFFKVPKGMAHQICIYIIFLRPSERNIFLVKGPSRKVNSDSK